MNNKTCEQRKQLVGYKNKLNQSLLVYIYSIRRFNHIICDSLQENLRSKICILKIIRKQIMIRRKEY